MTAISSPRLQFLDGKVHRRKKSNRKSFERSLLRTGSLNEPWELSKLCASTAHDNWHDELSCSIEYLNLKCLLYMLTVWSESWRLRDSRVLECEHFWTFRGAEIFIWCIVSEPRSHSTDHSLHRNAHRLANFLGQKFMLPHFLTTFWWCGALSSNWLEAVE